MTMSDFLLECFSEEIPARMQRPAMEALKDAFSKALGDARLEFKSMRGFVSSRHLAILISGLPAQQPDISIEKKGPKTSAPQPAIDGFLKSSGLALNQLEKRMVGKDETYFAVVHQKGQPTAAALKPIAEKILADFSWPKSMRWGKSEVAWVRPLHNILCLLDDKIIPVEFVLRPSLESCENGHHLTASNITFGHRFLAPAKITINHPSEYEAALEKAFVIVCPDKRKAKISELADKAAASKNLQVRKDAGLLEEVTGLVEYPNVLVGTIDDKFMDLPPEVLVSEMRAHQKYFALQNANSEFSKHFLITSNMTTNDEGKAIIAGNERVLRARLSDGRFFWDQDRNVALTEWNKKLSGITFHAKIGTVAEKVDRITKLAVQIAETIKADKKQVERAASLCKADLVTGMVGEFPELQGVMGRYYALQQKESADVADAIRDHYLPVGPDSPVPTAPVSVCVSLAEKIETAYLMFLVGEKPTGSKDPFALRRTTLGMIRILLDNNINLSIQSLLASISVKEILDKNTVSEIKSKTGIDISLLSENLKFAAIEEHYKVKPDVFFVSIIFERRAELIQFILDRLKVMLKDQGLRHDVIEAVLTNNTLDDLLLISERVRAVQAFTESADFENLMAGYRRAVNILTIEEKKDGKQFLAVDNTAFVVDEEKALDKAFVTAKPNFAKALATNDYTAAISALSHLRSPIDSFFDKVMVNDADPKIRANRLGLLNAIRETMNQFADFSKIEAPAAQKKAA
jgi:glycyl-tRNA synthetase beta chain